MPRESRDTRDTLGDAVRVAIADGVFLVPPIALLPMLAVLGDLQGRGRRVTAGMTRRALGRWRLIQRYAAIRRETGVSSRRAIRQVVRESADIAPGLRCEVRAMQRWIAGWNAIGPDGLAAGPASLVDGYGRSGRTPIDHDSDAV